MSCHKVRAAITTFAAVLSFALGHVSHAQDAPKRFALLVDPSRADAVERALRKIGDPIRVTLGPQSSPASVISEICRSDDRASWSLESSSNGRVVKLLPCIRPGKTVDVTVKEGDTLEGIAVRYGLHPSAAFSLKVDDLKGLSALIHPGETVTVPQAPAWTPFETSSSTTRADVATAIATELGCGREVIEDCLIRNSVILLDRSAATAVRPVKDSDWPVERYLSAFIDTGPASTWVRNPSVIASGQWPYDRRRVAAVLNDESQHGNLKRASIGVADNGLASSQGVPLPREAFFTGAETFIDSPYDDEAPQTAGAGISRDGAAQSNDDPSMCAGQAAPDFSSWPNVRAASHGAIVASIAFGLDLFSAMKAKADSLPLIRFYRLVPGACDAAAEASQVDEMALMSGFEWLAGSYRFITMSYEIGQDNAASFAARASQILDYDWKLLFVPAGNSPVNFNREAAPCPACLADQGRYNQSSRRVVVVGAATPALTRASYSGFGDRIVRLYAPGEPFGAVRITGEPADTDGASTSFATPRAVFAAAVMQTLGMDSLPAIKHRLMLASWPLLTSSGEASEGGERVLDLTKAVAVSYYSVEAFVEDGGARVRKTYVGTLVGRFRELAICSAALSPKDWQAFDLNQENDGVKTLRVYGRTADPGDRLPEQTFRGCRPSGTLLLNDLVDGPVSIPLADVTYILAPWTVGARP